MTTQQRGPPSLIIIMAPLDETLAVGSLAKCTELGALLSQSEKYKSVQWILFWVGTMHKLC